VAEVTVYQRACVGHGRGEFQGVVIGVPDCAVFKEFQNTFDTPNIASRGLSTQFSTGKHYWSPGHEDDNYFHTNLPCYSEKNKTHDDIIYNFVLPEYKCYMPLRLGDVLVFNPRVKHC
jgi:hypothetical protein